MFHVRAYGDLYTPNISFVDWNAKLSNFRNLLSQLNDVLNKESSLVTFEKFKFNDIEYSVKRDSFNWIIFGLNTNIHENSCFSKKDVRRFEYE